MGAGGGTGGANGGAIGKGGPGSMSGNGIAGNMAIGSGAGASCPTEGVVRDCCRTGTQTCVGSTEFHTWSQCVDTQGSVLNCQTNNPCGPGEFGPTCTGNAGSGGGGGGGDGGSGGGDAGPPPPKLCSDEKINNEPEILAAYSPDNGQSVSSGGQIKVWVNDEHPAIISAGEQVDPMSGLITAPGDRTAKAPDGYLWEPALYIAPDTAENGGTPHFPQYILGWYNANPPPPGTRVPSGGNMQVPGMDPVPPGTKLSETYTTEYIWSVFDLGLAPGTYTAEFVIHDGDRDRGVGCVTIVITR
jgi:hypothetical protein